MYFEHRVSPGTKNPLHLFVMYFHIINFSLMIFVVMYGMRAIAVCPFRSMHIFICLALYQTNGPVYRSQNARNEFIVFPRIKNITFCY